MFEVATWIRPSDETDFARFFAGDAGLHLANARLETVEVGKADALLLTGGADISAQFHNEIPNDLSLIRDAEPDRDAWEFAALWRAMETGLPIFCICRGLQLLNIALGGTLHLDIRGHDLPELKLRNLQPLHHDKKARHQFANVNSSHHQALDRIGPGFDIEAWSAEDSIIEQVRLRDYPFCVGVQYHPERDLLYRPLFEDFIAKIRARSPT